MKLRNLFTAIAVVAMMATVSSCQKETNPVEQFVNDVNAITAKIEKVETIEQFNSISQSLREADKIVVDNAAYELTESDKEALTEALVALTKASFTKGAKLNGIDVTDIQTEMITQNLKGFIANAKTLGNLSDNSMVAEENASETVVEETAVAPADSTIAE